MIIYLPLTLPVFYIKLETRNQLSPHKGQPSMGPAWVNSKAPVNVMNRVFDGLRSTLELAKIEHINLDEIPSKIKMKTHKK